MILSHQRHLDSSILSFLADAVESEKGLADIGLLRARGHFFQNKGTAKICKCLPLDIFP